jgi:hypothetical protein
MQPAIVTQINQPMDAKLNCQGGGYIHLTGTITGSIDQNGSGIIQFQAEESIVNWLCEPPFIVTGDPYVSVTGTFTFLNGAPATTEHVSISGGFQWSGPSSGSCQINLGMDFSGSGGHMTGAICGDPVDITI